MTAAALEAGPYTGSVPVYEFVCNGCRASFSVFVRSVSASVEPRCERCGSGDVRRLISRVAVLRGRDVSFDLEGGFDENDPRAMAAWARQMQREAGEDLGPEFDEMVGRLERGEALDDDFGGFDAHDHDDDLA